MNFVTLVLPASIGLSTIALGFRFGPNRKVLSVSRPGRATKHQSHKSHAPFVRIFLLPASI